MDPRKAGRRELFFSEDRSDTGADVDQQRKSERQFLLSCKKSDILYFAVFLNGEILCGKSWNQPAFGVHRREIYVDQVD